MKHRCKKIALFSHFSKNAMKKVQKIFKVRNYSAGSIIFSQNSKGDYIYIIVSGFVKIFRSSNTGIALKTLSILKKNEFFGEMALFDNAGRSASAKAITDVEVVACSRKDFLELLSEYPQTCLVIISMLASRLREADKEISALTFQNSLGRLAMILCDLASKHGVKKNKDILIDIELTHQDLAEMAGTAREVITKIISTFKKANCIKFDGKKMLITDIKKIKGWIY
ncbi:MAG: Crp/Fnr family transcriptional regulator [Elusimicrobia bacterium]|nr:Crp/Fnr family transcriptional regulator [Elusimicrobiota bacterium]